MDEVQVEGVVDQLSTELSYTTEMFETDPEDVTEAFEEEQIDAFGRMEAQVMTIQPTEVGTADCTAGFEYDVMKESSGFSKKVNVGEKCLHKNVLENINKVSKPITAEPASGVDSAETTSHPVEGETVSSICAMVAQDKILELKNHLDTIDKTQSVIKLETEDMFENLVGTEAHFPFICGYCMKRFSKIETFYLHLKIHSVSVSKIFHICDISEEKLVQSYRCDSCSCTFATICTLHDHFLNNSSHSGSYLYANEHKTAYPIKSLCNFFDSRGDGSGMRDKPLDFDLKKLNSSVDSSAFKESRRINVNEDAVTVVEKENTTINKVLESTTNVTIEEEINEKSFVPVVVKAEVFVDELESTKSNYLLESELENEDSLHVEIKRKRGRPRKDRAINIETKPKRGRPKKVKVEITDSEQTIEKQRLNENGETVVAQRGRPRKEKLKDTDIEHTVDNEIKPRTRGRPKKVNAKTTGNGQTLKKEEKNKNGEAMVAVEKKDVKIPSDLACEICGKVQKNKARYTHHLISHTENRAYHCKLCPSTYKYPQHLSTHMYSHNTVKPYYCEICGEGFIEISRLNAHKLTHSSERPVKCSRCDAVFKRIGTLNRHMLIHTGGLKTHTRYKHSSDRGFNCPSCEASFKRKDDLKRHEIKHSDTKGHQCDVCGQQFSRKYYLVQHMWIHTQQRRFSCNKCERRFFTNYQLQCHLKVHSGERPYKCPTCRAAFIQRKELRKHMKKNHGQNMDSMNLTFGLNANQDKSAENETPDMKATVSMVTFNTSEPVADLSQDSMDPNTFVKIKDNFTIT